MDSVELILVSARKCGKGASRSLRNSGLLPCVVYGDGKETESFAIEKKGIEKHCYKSDFFTKVFELEMDNKSRIAVLPKAVQYHPVTDLPLHVDFLRVSKKSEVKIRVPIFYVNAEKSQALKIGGILNVISNTIDLICSPMSIPEKFEVDLSEAGFGRSFTVSDLSIPKDCRLGHSFTEDTIIANIVKSKNVADTEETSDGASE